MYCTSSHHLQSVQFLDRTYKGPGQFYHCQTVIKQTLFNLFLPSQTAELLFSIQLELGQSISPHLQAQKLFKFEICVLLHFHSTFSKPTHFSTNQESLITVNTTPPILNSMLNPPLSQRPVRTYKLSFPEGLQL